MRILIVGAGLVGSTLADKLSRDGHNVSVIDSDADKFRELSDTIDVQVLEGNGATATMLRRAGIEESDLVVATTDSDEVNIVVGLLASALFHVGRIVVRLRDPLHQETFDLINQANPVDHVRVNPDGAAVDRIAALLAVPGAVDVVSFLEDRLLVAGFRIHSQSDFVGLRVSDMNLMFANTPTLAVAIERDDDWVIPHGEEVIASDDLVYFAISREHMEGVLQLVGVARDKRQDVMIAGATPIGLELARRLENLEVKVVLIEEDAERAQAASDELRQTTIIQGSVTSQGLLEEEEITRVSTFVAVTEDHETNLVAGLLAKRLGAGRAVVLVDNPELVNLVGQLGIDAIISPRVLVIGLILQHILGGRVHSAAQLLEDRVEIVEAEVAKGSALTRATLSEVKLPRGVLVAALGRGDTLLVPRGSDRAEP
ncbi:MAG: Trk system potassium transporter TrkA, partial [Myxococcales bacterium]|nr:Trk system potassium transporter TrkA [Myxococcales bacterium]